MGTKSPNWRPEANAILAAAIEINDAADRRKFVQYKCSDDPNLLRLVESLLASADEAGDFLEDPAITEELRPTRDPDSADAFVGTEFDGYKILQRIGEGGFGTVYMAQQREPHRRVALKVIKPGMDTKEVIARFEAERQALAIMDHPHIAKVYDAGTTDNGHPYFVMELVRGKTITDFCNANRLDTRSRLELFACVCDAVQHAHHKGIIHRDLKPNNVLVSRVDDRAMPKVIDFGIAKAIHRQLTTKTLFTKFNQFVGTPQYMSPEQAADSAVDVDTRSDVYSLGILLYELLTGATPLDASSLKRAGLDEIRRIIREQEPPTPSIRIHSQAKTTLGRSEVQSEEGALRLQRELKGEIDWIVMKALEKDRNRRYESPGAFAKDISRHLSGEPIEAGPVSWTYRIQKFIRRNRAAIFTVSIATLAMVLGLVGVTVGLIQSRHANRALMAANQELTAKNEKISADYLWLAFAAAQNNNLVRTQQLIAKALALGADPAEAETILAVAELPSDNQKAQAHFRRAIELNDESVAAHAGLSTACAQGGDLRGYFTYRGKAQALTPRTALDFQFMAACESTIGKNSDNAVSLAERSLSLTDSPAARSMASIVLARAAMANGDVDLARRAHEFASEASISLGRSHQLTLNTRLLALDALIVADRATGKDNQHYVDAANRCAEKLFQNVGLAGPNSHETYWLSNHYQFISIDLDKAEAIHKARLRLKPNSEMLRGTYAAFLLKRYGIEKALTMFERMDEHPRHNWSRHKEIVLRSFSSMASDREFARNGWRHQAERDPHSKAKMLAVLAALGEEETFKAMSDQWVIDRELPFYPVIEFSAGRISAEDCLAKAQTPFQTLELSYHLGMIEYGLGNLEAACEHFSRAVEGGNLPYWMFQWSDAFLNHIQRELAAE